MKNNTNAAASSKSANLDPKTTNGREQAVPNAQLAGSIIQVAPTALKPHARNAEIYSPSDQDALIASIKDRGILHPILATRDGTILSGHRRHAAAVEAGLKKVPVIYREAPDENDREETLIVANLQREKSNEEKVREYLGLKEIETIRADERMKNAGKNSSHGPKGKAGDIAAKKVGLSRPTATIGAKIVLKIDAFRQEGKKADAERLRKILNESSFAGAMNSAIEAGLIEKPKPGRPKAKKPSNIDPGEDPDEDEDEDDEDQVYDDDPDVEEAVFEESDVVVEGGDKHGKAYAHADEVVTFFRGRDAGKLTTQQKHDWSKILRQMRDVASKCGIKLN